MILTEGSYLMAAVNATCLPSGGGEAADSPITGGSGVVSMSVVSVTDTMLFAEMILTDSADDATRSDLMVAVNATCLPSGGGEAVDSPLTGGSRVLSISVVVVTYTMLFSEVILADSAANTTHSDLNRIALTSGVAVNDATFAGLALTLERN